MSDPSPPPRDEHLEALQRRAERAFARVSDFEKLWNSKRAIVGPSRWPAGEKWTLAEEGRNTLLAGGRPTPDQLAALEVAIRLLRPAPLSKLGRLENLPIDAQPVFPGWNGFRDALAPYVYSVGRVDDPVEGPQGTCFVVGEDLVVTNRHVLDMLSRGTRELAPGYGSVRFREEYGGQREAAVLLAGVRAVSETADLALLALAPGSTASRPPLPIAADDAAEGDEVAAIGYPLDDPVRNPLFIAAVFASRFGVKRGAPGEVMGMRRGQLLHDCTTLGGNSGSPLLSLSTGEVVGVHASGYFSYRNTGVAAGELAAFLKDAGVN